MSELKNDTAKLGVKPLDGFFKSSTQAVVTVRNSVVKLSSNPSEVYSLENKGNEYRVGKWALKGSLMSPILIWHGTDGNTFQGGTTDQPKEFVKESVEKTSTK